jgi:hypothetical protein
MKTPNMRRRLGFVDTLEYYSNVPTGRRDKAEPSQGGLVGAGCVSASIIKLLI